MAALFLDSSALVKRYIQEHGSAWVSSLFDPAAGNLIHVARITAVEVVSGIVRRARGGGITVSDASVAIANLHADFTGNFIILEITPALTFDAMRLTETHGLRAYDAVQLAAAFQVNNDRNAAGLTPLTLVSADADLNQAAHTEGLSVADPNAHP